MRAVVVTEPGQVELVDLPEPTPGPYEVRVKTEVACVCNATDGKLIDGHFPGVDKYPLTLGHESVGIVDAVGDKVRNIRRGDRVVGGLLDAGDPQYASGWGGFCEYTLAADHDAMVDDGVADEEHGWFECFEIQQPVARDIPVEEACLLCTWREVYGSFDDFHLGKGDRILVYGAGPVGLSFLKIGKHLGLEYIGVVDPLLEKRQKAMAMGADITFAPDDPELTSGSFLDGGKLDAVIDAVGRPAIVNAALPLIRLGGSICVYGVVADDSIPVEKHLGPYNFNLFLHQWPTRHRERAAQFPLCDLIRKGIITAAEFVTHDVPIEQITDVLEEIKEGKVLKALLRY